VTATLSSEEIQMKQIERILYAHLKPFEWYKREHDEAWYWEDYVGRYEIYPNGRGTWTFDSGECYSEHETEEEAKAAAYLSHIRRILSVLED
jgi:hypothetical protein